MRLESEQETKGLVKKVEFIELNKESHLSLEFVNAKGFSTRVNIPIKILLRDSPSNIKIGPYRSALEGEQVRYTENTSIAPGSVFNQNILEILTGSLAGKSYTF